MGIVIRQSFKTSLVTYIGFGLGYSSTLFLFPLFLSAEQIGVTRLLISIAMLFSTFATLGAGQICSRFFTYFKDNKEEGESFLFFLLLIGFAGSLFFGIAFFVLQNTIISTYSSKAVLFIRYLYYLIPLTIILIFSNILDSYSVINQRPVVSSSVREIGIRFLIIIGVCCVALRLFDFDYFVIFFIFAYAVVPFALIVYLVKEKLFFRRLNFFVFRSSIFKEIITFGFFILLANISGAVIANADSIVLSSVQGLTSTGIYTIAFFIATVVEVPKRSLSQAIIPTIANANKADDRVLLSQLYKKSSINQTIIGGIIFLSLWLSLDSIFALIPNGVTYQEGKWVVFFLGLAKLFDMFTGVNAEIVGTSRYYKIDLLLYSLIALIGGIFLNIYFINKMGLVGAAVATATTVFIFNIVRFIFLAVVLKIHPFTKKTIAVVVIIAVVFLSGNMLPQLSHPVVNILFKSLFVSAMFIIPTLIFELSEDITTVTKKIWIRFIS